MARYRISYRFECDCDFFIEASDHDQAMKAVGEKIDSMKMDTLLDYAQKYNARWEALEFQKVKGNLLVREGGNG